MRPAHPRFPALTFAVGLLLAGCGGAAATPSSLPAAVPGATVHSAPNGTAARPATSATPTLNGDAGTSAARILVIGDFGDGSPEEYRVATAMEAIAADETVTALVTTGDNLYTDDYEAAWTVPFGWVDRAEIPVYAAWGNHDIQSSGRRSAVIAALNPPARWYSLAIGGATLIVLDANDPSDRRQLEWLTALLGDLGEGPAVVAFHQPAFSCGRHGSTAAVQERWVPLFRRSGVDLVVNGHDHDYQRFEVDGVTYVVSGGGGRSLYPTDSCPNGTPNPLAVDDANFHFVVLDVDSDSIRGSAVSDQGEVLDSFEIEVDGAR